MKLLITLIAMSLCSLPAYAGLNKWVDENGKVHYSDSLPPDVSAESVRNFAGKGQSAAPAEYSSKSYTEREAELKKARLEKQNAQDKTKQEAAQKEERTRTCKAARENLRALEGGARLVIYDEKGEKQFLDDAARAQRINDARGAVSANCN